MFIRITSGRIFFLFKDDVFFKKKSSYNIHSSPCHYSPYSRVLKFVTAQILYFDQPWWIRIVYPKEKLGLYCNMKNQSYQNQFLDDESRSDIRAVSKSSTVRPQKWRIFSPAKTPSFVKTAIFEALVWFTQFGRYLLYLANF